ncbi:DUF523 and DUF1722 domain-containing protein [Acrocarpospora macrocephala]|uniref:DUF1722 domain-containing protein n=1 Tax=Acrocarpospora macrocephala TaxID=150177 RepID=A0A5M3WMD0_9ACTN|nr:DUF523 and DUF1722 domain-containing protein [Acrocarpospora macrocephala]GES10034.1 hypothetical protein Amac_036310 [Acrocarpospora macrocephala]
MSLNERDAVTKRYRAHVEGLTIDHPAMDRAAGVRPRVAVSSCLLGDPVRYDGGHSQSRFLADELDRFVEWVHVCPEMEAGLGTPRETLRLERGGRLVQGRSRTDVTETITAAAEERIRTLDIDGYVFKAGSPSCGLHGIPTYAGDQVVDRQGRGLFAGKIMEAFPMVPIEDEVRLDNAELREAFIERIFALARLRVLLATAWRQCDLVKFHSRHTMQLLAHDAAAYLEAGRIVFYTRRGDPRMAYAEVFRRTFSRRASIRRNVNVLQQCLGMIGNALDAVLRADLAEAIAAYARRQVPLWVPTAMLLHHARGEEAQYVRDQTYFAPYPSELRLRDHVHDGH